MFNLLLIYTISFSTLHCYRLVKRLVETLLILFLSNGLYTQVECVWIMAKLCGILRSHRPLPHIPWFQFWNTPSYIALMETRRFDDLKWAGNKKKKKKDFSWRVELRICILVYTNVYIKRVWRKEKKIYIRV